MAEMKISSIRVESHIDEVTEEVRQRVINWLDAVGQDAASVASEDGICPRDTGNLQESIKYHVHEDALAVEIGTNVRYAPAQEFGTSRGIEAHHFIQTGATKKLDDYQSLLQDALEA